MLKRLIQSWELRLSKVDRHRRASPFAWGLDHLTSHSEHLPAPLPVADFPHPPDFLREYVRQTLAAAERFFTPPPLAQWHLHDGWLTFPSSIQTPDEPNNLAWARYFPVRERPGATTRPPVVLVLPQWNADYASHVSVCQGLNAFGIASVRLSLPYHGSRRPVHQVRADYMVSPNLGRTLQAVRQAVHEVRLVLDWLESQGYHRFGIIGTSIGSCVAFLAYAFDPRLQVAAFNHVSSYFADVVWTGISTSHVRAGLEQHVTRHDLREYWLPISPFPYIERLGRPENRSKKTLLIAARYDMTFLPHLTRHALSEFERHRAPYTSAWMYCGHYTTGETPFKFHDGYLMINHMRKHLNPGGHVVRQALKSQLPAVLRPRSRALRPPA
ncbi:RcgR family putative quorum lactone hydrolase [Chloracidobacterium thermophilum]|uniref:Abhydrolase domain-containing 18 n=1 Tax=Chloracidobacterium thermophilum (strain B) TaxID=981222 RepID=G2LED8_CHLTF|nr:alpha/beta hydrolase family protein [Chloracidobacterium thermophilum]AEP11358.1 hypothetical protein Cabther_A0601 [Chloracidobacterium thermophilum B]QUV79262.1 alpha/beta hydrolase family protein [Chloracidobacterium thermophilum]